MSENGYPKYNAILKNNKPIIMERKSLLSPWVNITHLRYNIEKLLFLDNNRDFNYLQCVVELYELILVMELRSNCKRIRFDGKLVWHITKRNNFPKYLLFDLENNNIFLLLRDSELRKLDLPGDNRNTNSIDRKLIEDIKRKLNKGIKQTKQREICPKPIPTHDNLSHSEHTESTPNFSPVSHSTINSRSESASESPLSVSTVDDLMSENSIVESCKMCESLEELFLVRIDVMRESFRNIINHLLGLDGQVIRGNGYKLLISGYNFYYNFDPNVICDEIKHCETVLYRAKPGKYPKSLIFYKKLNLTIVEFEDKFSLFSVKYGEFTVEHCEIPPIKLYFRHSNGEFIPLTSDQYSVKLSIIGGLQFVFTVSEGTKCTMVRMGFELVWMMRKSTRNKSDTIKKVIYNLTDKTISILTDTLFKCVEANGNWYVRYKELSHITHYTEERGNLVLIDRNELIITSSSRGKYLINYETGMRCVQIRHYDRVIWTKKINETYPKGLEYKVMTKSKKFILQFEDKFVVSTLEQGELTEKEYKLPELGLYTRNGQTGTGVKLNKSDFTVKLDIFKDPKFIYSTNFGVKFYGLSYMNELFIYLKPGQNSFLHVICSQNRELQVIFKDKITLFKYIKDEWKEKVYLIPREITLYTRNPEGATVLLDTGDYRVELRDLRRLKYIINDNVSCSELRYEDDVIWTCGTGDKFINSLYVNKRNITINTGTKIIHYKLNYKGKWTQC
ncbi:hypothetical protein TpMuguga_02g00855 [Theileria parva strain Muguga]|uniref:Uncharacterized protein n=1 Tax=Theileria parva TaxID=5875 RepID=Q4N3Y3_THEPA|nr:uncharacterized protein TpMuguga_02g00855 [Theileria parva strain Muguga]EAN33140.1 hypothetical protein TpMuguga_02g00855 [Theileria parva strain Muguga]|eukprot:XP_765423.1 hypothetical protein [Theileria parva strain Muguga]